jgi:protocatechuate 3,4-dioxygenase beta subunit
MKNFSRRKFLLSSLYFNLVGFLPRIVVAKKQQDVTPTEIEGPFYPLIAQQDTDFDLTKINGQNGTAHGKVIYIKGRVLDTAGNPVVDALVDLWQANAVGRYRHSSDQSKAALDPNFQGWAIVPSGINGEFGFTTIFPGEYPAGNGWIRPPHIHFKITKKNFRSLTTQLYFENHELNSSDLLFNRKSEKQQNLMVAKKSSMNVHEYLYDIVIQRN